MANEPHPKALKRPVCIHKAACLTVFGDETETVEALLGGKSGLVPTPVFGDDGGEAAPLALRQPMQRCLPPRWWDDLLHFIKPIAGEPWGTLRRPVFVTSSNYGIDGLYGLGRERNPDYRSWATPHGCMDKILQQTEWGTNITILSHACVSAQLGLFKAAEMLGMDLADEVLVFSFDYVGPFVAAGFNSLKILNEVMPAPYEDRETGSIGLGDGLGYVVLRKDGCGPRISAQSLYNEMYHFTANAPDGVGFHKALGGMHDLLKNRNFWIKGHGTGTLEAGRMEAQACYEIFPDRPLISWKGALGHTLGSCALVELVLAMQAMRTGTIPGTVGTSGECFARNVAKHPFDAAGFDSVLLLSNAFGGAHGAMVMSND